MSRTSRGNINITHGQHLLDIGKTFTASKIVESLADDATLSFLIKCGDHSINLSYQTFVGGDCFGKIYESPTASADGTLMDIICNNRVVAGSDGCNFYHTPTVAGGSEGTLMGEALIAGGSGMFSRGGGSSPLSSWKLKSNTNYYVVITNKSGGAINVSQTFNFSCGE